MPDQHSDVVKAIKGRRRKFRQLHQASYTWWSVSLTCIALVTTTCVTRAIRLYFTDFPTATARNTCHRGISSIAASTSAGVCEIGEAATPANTHQPDREAQSTRCSQCLEFISSGILAFNNGRLRISKAYVSAAAPDALPRTAQEAMARHLDGFNTTSAETTGANGRLMVIVAPNARMPPSKGNAR